MITIHYDIINIVFSVLDWILSAFWYAVIAAAIFSTLVSFGVLDTRNRAVWTIGDFLYRVTEPVLRPIRNLLPNLGGLDISPIVALIGIQVAQSLLIAVHRQIMALL